MQGIVVPQLIYLDGVVIWQTIVAIWNLVQDAICKKPTWGSTRRTLHTASAAIPCSQAP